MSSIPFATTKKNSIGWLFDKVDNFDADFFDISPRVAEAMNPRQRLLLEGGWEPIEDSTAGVSRGSGRRVRPGPRGPPWRRRCRRRG
ncbi:beta-ketoacyl synthase N-terminal-like domain-containing protein [Nocardia tengchongensis]|uniref:beta-ketoacyl synthase N-terminal-like domain-containing protein n=1 Tax=Nocardia tengchongensis TaxID=2055889 RepID=UPI00368A6043